MCHLEYVLLGGLLELSISAGHRVYNVSLSSAVAILTRSCSTLLDDFHLLHSRGTGIRLRCADEGQKIVAATFLRVEMQFAYGNENSRLE